MSENYWKCFSDLLRGCSGSYTQGLRKSMKKVVTFQFYVVNLHVSVLGTVLVASASLSLDIPRHGFDKKTAEYTYIGICTTVIFSYAASHRRCVMKSHMPPALEVQSGKGSYPQRELVHPAGFCCRDEANGGRLIRQPDHKSICFEETGIPCHFRATGTPVKDKEPSLKSVV
jgi:hypothetical protein